MYALGTPHDGYGVVSLSCHLGNVMGKGGGGGDRSATDNKFK